MLKYNEALDKILECLSLVQKLKEEVDISDSLGRILAEDLISDINIPPFNNSAMDGYAVRFHPEIRNWHIIGELSAGNFQDIEMDYNQAVSIMTGAKLPEFADTVIPIEECIISGNEISIRNEFNLKRGIYIRLLGEDLLVNTVAISSGIQIKAKNINLAAACGYSKLTVYSRLNIGVLATGDELVSINSLPVNDQIRCSNLTAISASIKAMNMNVTDFGFIDDKQEHIEQKLREVLSSDIDILVTTGGVSVGRYDFMPDAIKAIGADIQFRKVNIKPGKPIIFSTFLKGEKTIPIFSLPGNPLSTFVNFKLFVEQAVYMSYGIKPDIYFTAKLKTFISKSDNRLHFVMAKSAYDKESNCFTVEIAGSQSSGSMLTMSNSDCMIVLPEELSELKIGEWVECIRI
ncbi:MAG: molybdopterin molybdotransferase MoeA [Candidatus Kapabacteria bacterium]|nr:molybdopterin molybdotransferase MoeA [Candidatus Kapabacteria bacterium]